MAKPRLKIGAAAERLRESLWLIPGLMVGSAVALAALLIRRSGQPLDVPLRKLLLPATAEGAVPVLQVVSASVITVTSVVFSLTVVALQITAGNYSPRALRTFLRDFKTQIVLGTFLATFAYSYLVLQNLKPITGSAGSGWDPQLAFLLVPAFVLASLIALVYFIHHVTQAIRVDFILRAVLQDNLNSIDTVHPDEGNDLVKEHPRDLAPETAAAVTSERTGFVQSFDLNDLATRLKKEGLVVAFRPSVGDHILDGSTLAWTWTSEGSRTEVTDQVQEAVRDAMQIGRERSMDHDVAYGLRQLVDIAVRALSPGVNDPNTAVAAVLHLGVAYRRLLTRQVGPVEIEDDRGTARVMLPYPSFQEYLTIMVQQVGHYGRADVMVVLQLLRTLGELKSLSPARHHAALEAAMDEVLGEAEEGLDVAVSIDLVREAVRDCKGQSSRFRHSTAAG